MLATALLLSTFAWFPQEPLRIGVIGAEERGSPDVAFMRGVRHAAESINKSGGVDGAKIEVVLQPATTGKEVAAAVTALRAAGIHGMVAPLEPGLAAAAQKAIGKDLPMLRFGTDQQAVVPIVDRLLEQHLCMTRVGLIRDRSKTSREFGKALAAGLTAPTQLLWELEVTTAPKKVQKQFEKDRPEILVFDTEPDAAIRFLDEMLAADPIPIVLLPRSYGAGMLQQQRTVLFVAGLSPSQTSTDSVFRRDYDRSHGIAGLGAAEGYESLSTLARAFQTAGSREPAAVQQALQQLTIEGVRGRYGFDAGLDAFAAPIGVWIVDDGRAVPYSPLVVPIGQVGTAADATATEKRKPQDTIGVPFGTWRTRRFVPEEGSQWVLCMWADDGGYATSANDLEQLGLSTGGKVPLVDHLVREEIFARVLAITSTKYLRNEDGTAVPGKSLRICFVTDVDETQRKKKKLRLWPARFGGDHEGAGGEAFGTFCRVYTMFIRRTIFQTNALKPALGADDRRYLDGTYVFGTDYAMDRRSEMIRALINGYAGSMALTLAHEVGHLASLGHVTDDPAEIMNVEEGAGIDYPQAHFGQGSLDILENRLGIVGETTTKRR
ncbi:MAG: ABC transporter substrate-binding protein [Planctomycetes bacterium]|nr:ABC transporter substrate-binding protein [Planctomycetota bacterium]